jgi:hypothetical protein
MADHYMLFKGAMVRAQLAGTKTQTRRIIEPFYLPLPVSSAEGQRPVSPGVVMVKVPARFGGFMPGPHFKLPYAVGDRICVRETHALHSAGGAVIDTIFYRATPDRAAFLKEVMPDRWSYDIKHAPHDGKWRPGIHMHRWASRLTLIVTQVRVERLQNISEEDALAEGIESDPLGRGFLGFTNKHDTHLHAEARHAYADLWNFINGAGAWEANPWVVVTSFEVRRGNIDALPSVDRVADLVTN